MMKTIDEVIKVFTKCFDNTYNIVPLECEPEYGEDALHYLKMLRDMTCGTSQKLRNTSQITCPKCHSEFVILPDTNTPLTWDELKDMIGKPIWIEMEEIGFWYIILNFEEGKGFDDYMMTTPFIQWWKSELGAVWNAYRKERE